MLSNLNLNNMMTMRHMGKSLEGASGSFSSLRKRHEKETVFLFFLWVLSCLDTPKQTWNQPEDG